MNYLYINYNHFKINNMKKLFTLSCILSFISFSASTATAQTHQYFGSKIHKGQSNQLPGNSLDKPASPESKLISSYIMSFDGTEYKRNFDSIRYFSNVEDHLDEEMEDLIMYDVHSIYFRPPSISYDAIKPAKFDSARYYKLNSSEAIFDETREQTLITRNANGKITQYLKQENTAGTWTDIYRYNILYNAGNQPTEFLYETFSGTWVNNRKKTFTYDTENHLESGTEMIWVANNWVNDRKYLYEYDAVGNCISLIYQKGSGNLWENDLKINYAYNANQKVSEIITSTWTITDWDFLEKLIYTYSAEKPLSRTLLYWVGTSWENAYKRTNNYNGDQLASSLLEVTNNAGGWQNQTLYENTYTSGVITSSIISNYNNEWEPTNRITLSRNAHNQITETKTEQKDQSGNWEFTGYSYRMFYEEEETGIDNIDEILKIKVYPNPSKNTISAEFNWKNPQNANLALLDIHGKILFQKHLSKSTYQKETIDVTSLANGIYLLTVTTEEGTSTKKVEVIK